MNICWYASLPMQLILLGRLARWRFPYPWFAWFLAYEIERSAFLIYTRGHGMEAYRLAWGLTEPIDAVLIMAMALESARRAKPWMVGAITMAYAALAGLGVFSGVNGLMMLRGGCLLLTSCLLVGYLPWRFRIHSLLVAAYCAFDASQAYGIVAGASGPRPVMWMIFGQTACIALWLLFLSDIRKENQ